jgi:hypothetical protein
MGWETCRREVLRPRLSAGLPFSCCSATIQIISRYEFHSSFFYPISRNVAVWRHFLSVIGNMKLNFTENACYSAQLEISRKTVGMLLLPVETLPFAEQRA